MPEHLAAFHAELADGAGSRRAAVDEEKIVVAAVGMEPGGENTAFAFFRRKHQRAGAIALKAEESDSGILATRLHADGRHNDLLFVDGGPSTTGTVGKLRMKGREVFRHAVVNLADVLNEVLDAAGLTAADVDWVVPHQANARILDATSKKLGLPPEKVVVTVDRHANTSAASVPLALDTAVRDGRIKRGDLVVLEAMGGGFTWGAAALKY
jgi:3-oxoacyl-[acyl-carrier-protein] synthase-3